MSETKDGGGPGAPAKPQVGEAKRPGGKDARAERLAAALRANLGRRKAAARAGRAEPGADVADDDAV